MLGVYNKLRLSIGGYWAILGYGQSQSGNCKLDTYSKHAYTTATYGYNTYNKAVD